MNYKGLIATLAYIAFVLISYFILPKPIVFSPLVSALIMILLGLAFVVVLIFTLRVLLIDRRVVKGLIGTLVVIAFALISYFILPKPIVFSPLVSALITILLGLAFVVVLIFTLRGRLIELMNNNGLIATLVIIDFILICYFILPKPIEFSPLVSVLITILLGLAFVVVLIYTLKGRLIERRVVFLFVGVALVIPFFMQFPMPLQISPEVQSVYDKLESLEPGAKVLCAFDYDPPSAPELQPMADAFMRYAFERDFKVIIMGLWPQGPQQANQAIEAAFEVRPEWREQKKYGVDYVNLGFQAGNEFVILRMGQSFKAMFPLDLYNTPYDSIPMLRNVSNYSNIDLGMNFSAGKPGTVEWVQLAVDRYRLPMAAGNTAVQAPMAYPYLNAGQLIGLMGGMTGGAEFEKLTGKYGKATTYILSQSFAHMVVIIFILIGNVAFFRERNGRKA